MSTETVTKNYYEVLGVKRSAKLAQIRRRYLALTQEAHPDRVSDPVKKAQKSEEFKWINEAWEVLSNRDQRNRYDSSLDGHSSFDPDTVGGKSAESIFNDAKRFEFHCLPQLPDSLREMVAEYLKGIKEFDHRVVATFAVKSSNVGSSPLTAPCGASFTEHLVLTNMRLLLGAVGTSILQEGNTKTTMTYSRMRGIYWGLIDRLDITASFAGGEKRFKLRINAPENFFSGVEFECVGSPLVLLWIADLFDIRVNLQLGFVGTKSSLAPLFVGGIAAVVGYLIATKNDGVTSFMGVCLFALAIAHGVFEAVRSSRSARLARYVQRLVGNRAGTTKSGVGQLFAASADAKPVRPDAAIVQSGAARE